jgi:hypothetical protein
LFAEGEQARSSAPEFAPHFTRTKAGLFYIRLRQGCGETAPKLEERRRALSSRAASTAR